MFVNSGGVCSPNAIGESRSVPASGAIPAPIYAAKTKETTFAPTPFAQLTPPAVVFTETERETR